MLDILVLWICKTVFFMLRKLGKHGAALPGLTAERLRPGLLAKLTDLPEGVIIISGTNGKTTTTHLVTQVLKRAGKSVFTNHSGSNMTRGLLSSIVRFSSLSGHLPYDIAVLEVDEAYAAKLAPRLKPRAAILTNVLRDQLDRFGEIDYTAKLLIDLAKSTTELVVYNGGDPRLAGVRSEALTARTVSFGFDPKLWKYFPSDDDWYDGEKKKDHSPRSDYILRESGQIAYRNKTCVINSSSLPGWHNQLNLTAVFALLSELEGLSDPKLYDGLTPPYGRGEEMVVGECRLTLQLVKNPAGFRTAMDVKPEMPALIVINDAIADSRDVSWIWDVDVSPLSSRSTIICSGSRAYDMSVRLKYNEISVVNTSTEIPDSLNKFIHSNREGVVFLTYTAMLQARTYLNKLKREKEATV